MCIGKTKSSEVRTKKTTNNFQNFYGVEKWFHEIVPQERSPQENSPQKNCPHENCPQLPTPTIPHIEKTPQ